MSLETIHALYKNLEEDNFCLIYQGQFNDDMTEKLIGLSEYNIDNKEGQRQLKKKVSFLIAESFQNIVRHVEEPGEFSKMAGKAGIFSTRYTADVYYITSANLIENDKIDLLKSKLEEVNALGPDELKKFYLEKLSTGQLSAKGGAGLGLIEMARKSGHQLEFEFERINAKLSNFHLGIKLYGKKDTGENGEAKSVPFTIAKNSHRAMISRNILMVYKGDFSRETISPLLKVIEDNMVKQLAEFHVIKRLYFILIEVLQNISKHSREQNGVQDGILMIGKKDGDYVISAGNLLYEEDVRNLRTRLRKINELDKNGLVTLFRKTLKEGIVTEKHGAGLGLIDIARLSNDRLSYDFTTTGKKMPFFSLQIRV